MKRGEGGRRAACKRAWMTTSRDTMIEAVGEGTLTGCGDEIEAVDEKEPRLVRTRHRRWANVAKAVLD